MAPDWREELLNTLEWKAPYGKYLAIDSIKEIGPDEALLKRGSSEYHRNVET